MVSKDAGVVGLTVQSAAGSVVGAANKAARRATLTLVVLHHLSGFRSCPHCMVTTLGATPKSQRNPKSTRGLPKPGHTNPALSCVVVAGVRLRLCEDDIGYAYHTFSKISHILQPRSVIAEILSVSGLQDIPMQSTHAFGPVQVQLLLLYELHVSRSSTPPAFCHPPASARSYSTKRSSESPA